jgi:hypothetical protein
LNRINKRVWNEHGARTTKGYMPHASSMELKSRIKFTMEYN